MSKVSDVYDRILLLLETELPSYAQIPNAYDLGANANLFVQKGYAIGFGPAINTEKFTDCNLSVNRTFSIVLTQQVTANITDFDGVNAVAKQLFEDQYKIIKAIEKDPQLMDTSVTKFTGDGGLEFLTAGQAKYFLIEMQFDSEYFENLNS